MTETPSIKAEVAESVWLNSLNDIAVPSETFFEDNENAGMLFLQQVQGVLTEVMGSEKYQDDAEYRAAWSSVFADFTTVDYQKPFSSQTQATLSTAIEKAKALLQSNFEPEIKGVSATTVAAESTVVEAASAEVESLPTEELKHFGLDTLWGVEPVWLEEIDGNPGISAFQLDNFYTDIKGALQQPGIADVVAKSEKLQTLLADIGSLFEEKIEAGKGILDTRELHEVESQLLLMSMLTKLHSSETGIQESQEVFREIVQNRLRVIQALHESLTPLYDSTEVGEAKNDVYNILKNFESDKQQLAKAEIQTGIKSVSAGENDETVGFLTKFAELLARTDANIEHGLAMLDQLSKVDVADQEQVGSIPVPTPLEDSAGSAGPEASEDGEVLAESQSLLAQFNFDQLIRQQFGLDENATAASVSPEIKHLFDQIPFTEAGIREVEKPYLEGWEITLRTWEQACREGRDLTEAEQTEYESYKAARYAFVRGAHVAMTDLVGRIMKTSGRMKGAESKKVVHARYKSMLVDFTVVQDYQTRAEIKAEVAAPGPPWRIFGKTQKYISLSKCVGWLAVGGAAVAPAAAAEYGAAGLTEGVEREAAVGAGLGTTITSALLGVYRETFRQNRVDDRLVKKFNKRFVKKRSGLISQKDLDALTDNAEEKLARKINQPRSWGFWATNAAVVGAGGVLGATMGAVGGRAVLEWLQDTLQQAGGTSDPAVTERLAEITNSEPAPAEAPAPVPRPDGEAAEAVVAAPLPADNLSDAAEPNIITSPGEAIVAPAEVAGGNVGVSDLDQAEMPVSSAVEPASAEGPDAPIVNALELVDATERITTFLESNISDLQPGNANTLADRLLGSEGKATALALFDALSASDGFVETVPELQAYINGLEK